MLYSLHMTMESHLGLALNLISNGTTVYDITKNDTEFESHSNIVCIERFKYEDCPDETRIINAFRKKIERSDILNANKNTLNICILLLMSRDYCITSNTLSGIEDTFIERCWECIQVASHSLPESLSLWIEKCMSNRTASNYAALFCTTRPSNTKILYLERYISGQGEFLNIDPTLNGIPDTVWHRNDFIRQTIILHMNLCNREMPYDREGS